MATTASNFQKTRSALRFSQLSTGGNIFFAGSAAGAAAATGGFTADGPSLTLAQAIALATADNNETIYVLGGHTEAFSAAAALTIATNGLTIIGLGNGNSRPTFTWGTSTAAQMIVSAAAITFRNLRFDFTGIDAIVAAISVTGADVAFEDCEFTCNNATIGVVLGILTAATATRFRVERCRFLGAATNSGTTTTAQIKHEVGVDFLIKDNYFEGKMTQAILNATAILRGNIDNNRMHIYTGTKGIALHASTPALISNNRIVVASGTSPSVATGATHIGNVYGTEALTIGTPTAAAF